MKITKEDIIQVLNDILKEDIPYWDLDPDTARGLNGEQLKKWYMDCMKEAIKIIENKRCEERGGGYENNISGY